MAVTKHASVLPIAIRLAQPADREAIRRVVDAVCSEGRWMYTSAYTPTPEWEHAFACPGCRYHLLLACQSAGQTVGWCRVFSTGDQSAEVGLGLLPAYRNCGIGSRLVQRSVAWAAQNGYRQVIARVLPGNDRSLHVFRKFGFYIAAYSQDGMLRLELNLPRHSVKELSFSMSGTIKGNEVRDNF